MTTAINLGVRGATRTSWMEMSPRELLKELLIEHPRANRDKLEDIFAQRIRDDETGLYMNALIEYWFSNHYRYLTEKPDPANARIAVESIKGKIIQKIAHEAKIILLDTVFPNGKKLRDCTGKDCAYFGSKMGLWLTAISQKVKATEKVGDILSEKQVRSLYDK